MTQYAYVVQQRWQHAEFWNDSMPYSDPEDAVHNCDWLKKYAKAIGNGISYRVVKRPVDEEVYYD